MHCVYVQSKQEKNKGILKYVPISLKLRKKKFGDCSRWKVYIFYVNYYVFVIDHTISTAKTLVVATKAAAMNAKAITV